MPGFNFSFKIDPSKVTKHIPSPVKKAFNAAAEVSDRVDHAFDSAGSPINASRLRGCKVPCDAELTGVADLPRLGLEHGGGWEVALLRLRVARPEGEVECCVRQGIPGPARRILAPDRVQLKVMAHESDARFAIVDWEARGKHGEALPFREEVVTYQWPDPDEWPAVGAIEVRDNWRHRRKIEERRQTWASAGARLVDASTRGSYTDDREDWKLELLLDDGRQVTVKERMPFLLRSRLIANKQGDPVLGGLGHRSDLVVRAGAPIAVLVSAQGDVAVDWQATLRYPELLQPESL